MNKTFCALGAALVLAACASQPSTADAEQHAACRDTDPRIGSHVVKRSDCGVTTTPEQREEARRQAEAMQQTRPIILK